MDAYYNEIDQFAATWIENLIASKLLPQGTVDRRSIKELCGEDFSGYKRVHLFAGIGGWEEALRIAAWPVDVPVWTGSCPCQPFSQAGKRKGAADERHLWPEMFRLIGECQPAITIGEQVGGSDGLKWLDGVFADLEGIGYACGAANLPCASVGSPHIRQRLFWVAYTGSLPAWRHDQPGVDSEAARSIKGERVGQAATEPARGGSTGGGLVDANGTRLLAGRTPAAGDRHRGTALTDGSINGLGE